MKRVLKASEMRLLDELAVKAHALPVAVLMENAGAALAEEALRWASSTGRFIVFAGPGNNGGDGLVAARKLARDGRTVFVEWVMGGKAFSEETERNWKALANSSVILGAIAPELPVGPGDVVIDALLGTGLSRPPDAPFAEAIGRMSGFRAAGAKVVSADIPSGLQSDTGRAYSACVRADATVSFAALKVGQAIEPGASHCGHLNLADIGIPAVALAGLPGPFTYLVDETDVCARISPRQVEAHKGTAGHVLLIAGSRGKSGAAALAAKAALRTGAGLVTVATRGNALSDVLVHVPEAMGFELPKEGALELGDLNTLLDAAEGKQAVVVGPGIARGPETGKLMKAFLEELAIPCVVDADALNAFTGEGALFAQAKGPLLLTPHPGEMARLLVKSTSEVQQDRLTAARTLAAIVANGVVLKGARTIVCRQDGTAFINPTGNAGMATAGAGDVLSGILGALLAQGLSVEDAALTGVFAHGLAGDLASVKTGMTGLVASDLIEALKDVWVRWKR